MPAQVHRIQDGFIQPTGREPNEDLVSYLEELLEKARSGEIIGIAGGVSYPSPVGFMLPCEGFRAGWSASTTMVGTLDEVKFRILRSMNDDD